jgi:hypothetical protein
MTGRALLKGEMSATPVTRAFAVGGIPPRQIRVSAALLIDCPRHGRVDVSRCHRCPLLQGTLEGMGLIMLCGLPRVAQPSRIPSSVSG